MQVQEIFYVIASIALALVSVFLVALIVVLYKVNRLAQSGMRMLTLTARDAQDSLASMAKSWGRITLAGTVLRIIRGILRR